MSLNQQIEHWLISRKSSFRHTHRPFVTLAFAQSCDGSITTGKGETITLSCAESQQLTHQLRALHQGILVGIETVLTDDPRLTVRNSSGENPQPIVLDSRQRIPTDANLLQHPDKTCWILTAENTNFAGEEKQSADIAAYDAIPVSADSENRVDLHSAMQAIKDKNIESLMVEGGATVITEFLRLKLADAIVMTVAPKIIGGYKAVGALGIDDLALVPEISPVHYDRLGQDLIVWGDMQYRVPA